MILASGCRERPRSARLVPGSRPAGIEDDRHPPAARPSQGRVAGAATRSSSAPSTWAFSARLTLTRRLERSRGDDHRARAAPVADGVRAGAAVRFRTPLWTRTRVSAIHGRPRVEKVELTDPRRRRHPHRGLRDRRLHGGRIPDNELAVMGGLSSTRERAGPAVDEALRTSRPGCSPPATSCTARSRPTLRRWSGRHAAASVARFSAAWRGPSDAFASTPVRRSTG